MKSTNDLYNKVVKENEGINNIDVKKIFMWYDLLGFALSFQLLFIFSYLDSRKYEITIFSGIFIILVDSIIKNILEKNPRNYKKLREEIPLVKLWTVPLMIMAIATTISLLLINWYI